jgi:hypothetical protein
MNLKHLLLFVILLPVYKVEAQKQISISDSLWCDHLNEIIKCASIDIITDRIAKDLPDSDFIAPRRPELRLLSSNNEIIKKEYGKVSYEGYLYADQTPAEVEKHFGELYKKLKVCLYLWEEAKLKNGDQSLTVPDDYFFTNSEDETTVRLDIIKDKTYHVRLRIF